MSDTSEIIPTGACACLRVKYIPVYNGDGSFSSDWKCERCGRHFVPVKKDTSVPLNTQIDTVEMVFSNIKDSINSLQEKVLALENTIATVREYAKALSGNSSVPLTGSSALARSFGQAILSLVKDE